MRSHRSPSRAGFGAWRAGVTLVELMVTVTVLGIVGAATLPVILGVSDSYAQSTRTRSAIERNAFAADRLTRWVREIPEGPTHGTVAIAAASATSIRLIDGRRIELNGGSLVEVDATGDVSVLLEGVTTLELRLLAADGITDTSASPDQTQRVGFTLTSDGATLCGIGFIRARMTEP